MLTLTYIFATVFGGMIIGSLIAKNFTLAVWSVVLFIINAIVGIVLQTEADRKNAMYGQPTLDDVMECMDEIKENINEEENESLSPSERELKDKFNAVFARLNAAGGTKRVVNSECDGAIELLHEVCATIPHAPMPHTLLDIHSVTALIVNEKRAVAYSFRYRASSMCENVYIYLVRISGANIRLFAVETDGGPFCICEYVGNSHRNYGRLELKDVPQRIADILNGDERETWFPAPKKEKREETPKKEETLYVTFGMIAEGCVDLLEARRALTKIEFLGVEFLYEVFKRCDIKIAIDNEKEIREAWCVFAAHYDLVAPYYKFCGNDEMHFKLLLCERGKADYRRRAKRLIDSGKICGSEWLSLHKEFLYKFYL